MTTTSVGVVVGVVGALVVVGRGRAGRATPRGRSVAGAGAAIVVLLAVSGPVSGRAEESFAWHMVQHLVLVGMVPPLLVVARPGPDLRRGLRHLAPVVARGQRALAGLAVVRGLRGQPVLLAVLAAGVLWAWHHPVLYQAALGSEPVHGLEHVTLLASSVLAWTVAVRGRAGHGAGLVALLVLAMAGATLGAVLTFASRPLYPAQTLAGDALGDQQVAGLLMWVPGGVVPLVAAAVLAADWVRVAGRRVEERERLRLTAPEPHRVGPVRSRHG